LAKCLTGNLVILIPVLTLVETLLYNYEKNPAKIDNLPVYSIFLGNKLRF